MNISTVDFGKGDGLVPAIVQDADTGAVLMLAYMNREALEQTLARKRAVFYSRSKQRLWEKGETTGHTLDVVDVVADCDSDTLLVTARPRGPACHNGTLTCFGDKSRIATGDIAFLAKLEAVIAQRATDKPENSYTALASHPHLPHVIRPLDQIPRRALSTDQFDEQRQVLNDIAPIPLHK